jgi:hypothetical protein
VSDGVAKPWAVKALPVEQAQEIRMWLASWVQLLSEEERLRPLSVRFGPIEAATGPVVEGLSPQDILLCVDLALEHGGDVGNPNLDIAVGVSILQHIAERMDSQSLYDIIGGLAGTRPQAELSL